MGEDLHRYSNDGNIGDCRMLQQESLQLCWRYLVAFDFDQFL